MIYDVIVVGGGIAGASAAFFLKRQGTKVLVIEKEKLPRYKPCAGGVPRSVLQFFHLNFEPVIEREINGVRYSFRGKKEVDVPFPTSPVLMVMRDQFDWFVLEKSGAEVAEGVKVIGVYEDRDKVTVLAEKGYRWQARYLIGADGANSVVARALDFETGGPVGAALEAEIPADEKLLDFFNKAFFLFGVVNPGYIWVFPKKAVLSAGIGAMGKTRDNLKTTFLYWMARLGLPADKIPLRAHPLPVYLKDRRLHSSRTVLIGDAARMMDPLLGEGIRYGVKSAHLAVQAILKGDLPSYTRAVHRILAPNFKAARLWAWVFYRYPEVSFELGVRNPFIIADFARMFEGKLSYRTMLARFPFYVAGLFRRF
ncbi:MAG: geranylgeranyl reductase family protein [Anaerolineae bacterium]|nr:geranylgeranyl reductase family protein [Anaerolineae bacterium]